MSVIFEPVILPGGLRLRNRLVVAPMTTYSSYDNGRIHEDELAYLRRRAQGGFGMVMTAACYVHPSGHAFPGQWSCAYDEDLPSLRAAAAAIREGGAAAVLQIHHGGRMCPPALCGGTPWSASDIPANRPNAVAPRAMTEADISDIIEAFARAAWRAKEAGFDGVEIHGANTYLLQQFVSPHSNRRDDIWGQDRLRFPLAVTDAVLAAVGKDYPVGYRFSPEEQETPGIRWADTEALVRGLLVRPLAWLHLSVVPFHRTSLNGDFDEPTLTQLARVVEGRVPVIGVGEVRTLADAEACVDLGADLVALGRVAISDPEWPQRVAAGEPPRFCVPANDAARILTLPAGLEAKIYGVPGWFQVEEASKS